MSRAACLLGRALHLDIRPEGSDVVPGERLTQSTLGSGRLTWTTSRRACQSVRLCDHEFPRDAYLR
jgi:hypothetical protein